MSSSRIPPTGFLAPPDVKKHDAPLPYYDSSSRSGIYQSHLPRRQVRRLNDPAGVLDAPESPQVELPIELQRSSWVKKIEENVGSDHHGHDSAYDDGMDLEAPPPGHEEPVSTSFSFKAGMEVDAVSANSSNPKSMDVNQLKRFGSSKSMLDGAETPGKKGGEKNVTPRKDKKTRSQSVWGKEDKPEEGKVSKNRSQSLWINTKDDDGPLGPGKDKKKSVWGKGEKHAADAAITSVASPKAGKKGIGESMRLTGRESSRNGAPIQWMDAGTMVGHFRPKYGVDGDEESIQAMNRSASCATPIASTSFEANAFSPLVPPAHHLTPVKVNPNAKVTDFIESGGIRKVGASYTEPVMGFTTPVRAATTEPYITPKKFQGATPSVLLKPRASIGVSSEHEGIRGTPSFEGTMERRSETLSRASGTGVLVASPLLNLTNASQYSHQSNLTTNRLEALENAGVDGTFASNHSTLADIMVAEPSICIYQDGKDPRDLVASSPQPFQVPDWSAMDPFTLRERNIIEELSRCRHSPAAYAEGLEKTTVIRLPVDMLEPASGSGVASPTASVPASSAAAFAKHAASTMRSNESFESTLPPSPSAWKWIEVSGAQGARQHIEEQQAMLDKMVEVQKSGAPPVQDPDPKKKGSSRSPQKAKKGDPIPGDTTDNEFNEGNNRIQRKQRHLERLHQQVRDSLAFLDPLKETEGPLPRAGYNRGLCLAAREIAATLGKPEGRRVLTLQDQLAQYGKLTGEISEFIYYGVRDPIECVEGMVSSALKAMDEKVLLYPTKLYAGAGWQRHATKGAVTVVLLASGFQEISYIKKHRNLPIIELKRAMSLGQMSADERLYDLNFIPEHYGIKALRPVAHPVMCGAMVELVLQCPPTITLSCATEALNGESQPSLSYGTTFVDRIGRTAKVHAMMQECKPCKLIVYARHPNEMVYKKASTILLRPSESLWRAADAQPFPDQLEQFQMLQGELIRPRCASLKENGTAVSFVIRLLGNSRRATLRGSHGSAELQRTTPRQSGLLSSPTPGSPQVHHGEFHNYANNTGGNTTSGADGLGENVCVNRSATTYTASLVVKAGPLSLWIDELNVLRWNVL